MMSEEAPNTFGGKPVLRGIWEGEQIEYVAGEALVGVLPDSGAKWTLESGVSLISRLSGALDSMPSGMRSLFGDLSDAWAPQIEFDEAGIAKIEFPIDAKWDMDISTLSETGAQFLGGLRTFSEAGDLGPLGFVEPNIVDRAFALPDSPELGKQWALERIGAHEAWELSVGSPSVTLVVLDSGIPLTSSGRLTHPGLNDGDRFELGGSYVPSARFPLDDGGHGTHVTGIAAAAGDDGVGIAGLDWRCRVRAIKVFDRYGRSTGDALRHGLAEACRIADGGSRRVVVNYSGGGPRSHTKLQWVLRARENGCVVVAAAGNSPTSSVHHPAALSAQCDNTIAVSATGPDDGVSSYSTTGPEINVAAPGGANSRQTNQIYSTLPNYPTTFSERTGQMTYGYMQGTSMASPYVAGLATLVLAERPDLLPRDVRRVIEDSAVEVGGANYIDDGAGRLRSKQYGYGRIRAKEALELANVY